MFDSKFLKSRPLSAVVLVAFLLQPAIAFTQSKDNVRLSLAYTSEGHPADATLFFGNLDGDRVAAGGPVLFEGYLVDYATGINHPYSVEILADVLAGITMDPAPQLEDSPEQVYNIYQDGERVPVTLHMETSADPLKANSYVHTGSFVFEETGKVVTFSALNDPVPVVVIVGGAIVLLICGVNIIAELVESCAEEAKNACEPNGVKWCEARITAWSLLMGCSSECRFVCHSPAPPKVKGPPAKGVSIDSGYHEAKGITLSNSTHTPLPKALLAPR